MSEISNSSVPPTYVHSLECFISAKQEFISKGSSTASKDLSAIYDYQHKYVAGLVKQMPPNAAFPMEGKSVLLHPPRTIKASPLRQGPFLLQPSPRSLEGSEGGDATDITYLSFPTTETDSEDETKAAEQLGVLVASYQDGRVDLFLDVEKVEARWDVKEVCLFSSIS
jgi:nucleoporin NUP82